MISKNYETPLQLVSKMTLVTNRIDLVSARTIFNSLRANLKIKLPDYLINSIDNIITQNMTVFMHNYVNDLCAIR